MCDESADNFDKIHNHATWAVAAVGMTGYVLRDQALVDKALRGSKRDGKAGFLAQVDQLFSPDGYYAEGPYYQRYALAPFVLFANAIARNQPQQRIFQRRDGVLLKAVDSLVQSSYGGYFFPINDAILDKGLDTEELVAGIGIAYAQTHDAQLLSIAQRQRRVLLTPKAWPWPARSRRTAPNRSPSAACCCAMAHRATRARWRSCAAAATTARRW
ncbi:alginate lyase family protein [Xanthomonas euroxanthea]